MKTSSNKKELSPKQRDELLAALKARFDANKARHPGLVWAKVQARLESRVGGTDKLWSLAEMECTGGEPKVVSQTRSNLFGWRGQFTPDSKPIGFDGIGNSHKCRFPPLRT